MKSNLINHLNITYLNIIHLNITYLDNAPSDGLQSPLLTIHDDFCDQLFSIVVESVYNFNVLYN